MATHQPDTERERTATRKQSYGREPTGLGGPEARRFGAGVLGGALVVRGLRRRGVRGLLTALVGGGLLAYAVGRGDRLAGTLRPGAESAGDATSDVEDAQYSVSRSITVGKPADELYETWRDPQDLARILGHFADVTEADDDHLRWTVHGPADRDVSWETRFVEDEPGEVIRWESMPDATVPSEGEVRFDPAPGDRGTEVTLWLSFDPPGGAFGATMLERLDVVPRSVAGTALGRFKSLAETGEIPTLKGNPSARGEGDLA